MKIAITTTRNPDESLINKAYSIATQLDIPYVKRGNYSISKISQMNEIEYFLFVEKDKIVLKGDDNTFFWHPSTAGLKLSGIKQGFNQPMVEAMNLKEGDKVLDCTLGIATDVINSSYEEYILSQPDNSFDVVYFDPMFKKPNKKSASINSLRLFAQQGGLKKETLIQALRICKNCQLLIKSEYDQSIIYWRDTYGY